MKTTVSCHDFINAFLNADRAKQFSRAGLVALFDYLEDYEADTGEEIELDVIALCCDYSEYETALECAIEYGYEADEDEVEADEYKVEADALEWLQERTHVIEHADGVIIFNF